MATFTSVISGNWDDGATWGKTSPGVKGTDWPGNAGDVVNIGTTANQSHVVTYNVFETNELGQITIGATLGTGVSRLEFARTKSTKLTLGHQEILVNQSAELRVGSLGAIIPKDYTAELIWNTTAENTKGINIAAGGKLNIYGDPDYFGSDYDANLVSQAVIPTAGNPVTIIVGGDFTTKWRTGQELIAHKGGNYGHYNNDFCRLAIVSLSANGGNTNVSCIVIERPATITCLFGADIINVSRNVLLYKLGYNANIGQSNVNRPRLISSNNYTSFANVNVNDVVFAGFYKSCANYMSFNGVCRNGWALGDQISYSITSGCIFGLNPGINYGIGFSFSGKIFNIVGNGISNAGYCYIAGDIFGCALGVKTSDENSLISANVYSCAYGISLGAGKITGNIGSDSVDNVKRNLYDLQYPYPAFPGITGNILFYNNKIPSGLTHTGRNMVTSQGRFRFEHFQQVTNAHYIADCFGDIYKTPADGTGDNPTQRDGGAVAVCVVTPLSLCSDTNYLEIFNVRLWGAAGINKTYRFYVQTDFANLPAVVLTLYGEYLDEDSGGHLARVASVQDIATRANAGDWSQYVEVTINPAQDGYVNLYLRLMGYEAGKKAWVDPKPEGVSMTPRWSYGEVVLEPATTSGANLSNPGLVPLGVKQVAI